VTNSSTFAGVSPPVRTSPPSSTAGTLLDAPLRYTTDGGLLLDAPPPDGLVAHTTRYGPPPADSRHVLPALEASGLTGRGGAHYPVVAKLRALLSGGGAEVVVANGAESEPASSKDAALLRQRPHLVLDGLTVAARLLGAGQAVIWLHEGAADNRGSLLAALRERHDARVPGPRTSIVLAPGRYLAGESSAVRSALAGGPVLPTFGPAPGARTALGGRGTLVQNVETLAWLAVLARGGAVRPGALVTVVADGMRTVLEADERQTVESLLLRAVELPGRPVIAPRAVLLGGYAGAWLAWDDARTEPLCGPSRSPATGAGLVAALPPFACGLAETAALLAYLARHGAGQCGPCRFGLPSLAGLADRLARGHVRPRDVDRIRRLADEVRGRGACHHPDGAVRLVETALATFRDDVEHHVRRGRCAYGGHQAVLPIPEER